MTRFFQLPLLLLLMHAGSMAAEPEPSNWVFRTWQTEDGLPDNAVSGVAQSPDGYLWVGTKGGLQRFNGREFETVPLQRFPGLRSRAVRAMFLDRRGQLWLNTERGPVIRLSAGETRVFSTEDGIPRNLVRRILEDDAGVVWLIMQGEIVRITGDQVSTPGKAEGIPPIAEPSAATDGRGNIWLAGRQKLGVIRGGRFEPRKLPGRGRLLVGDSRTGGPWIVVGQRVLKIHDEDAGDPEEIGRLPEGAQAEVLYEDHEGALWIGTRHSGLWRLAKGLMEPVPTADLSIESLCEDQEGNLWVGTSGGGLNMVRRRVAEILTPPDRLPFPAAISVAEDSEGKLWVVGAKGELAVKSADGWQSLTDFAPMATCLTTGPNGGIWVGSRNKGVWHRNQGEWQRLDRDAALPSPYIRSLMRSNNGDLWIATDFPNRLNRLRDDGFVTLDGPAALGPIRALAESPDGRIWVGTANGEILRVEGDHLVVEIESDAERPLLSVRDLHATADGSLWIGFAGDGIGWLKNGNFRRITSSHGLRDDYVSQLIADGRGGMWIAANRGLFQVGLRELLAVAQGGADRIRCRAFGRSEGLPSLQPSRNYSPSKCRMADGRLCFAMLNGLLMVRPDKIRNQSMPPPVVIEEVSLDGRPSARYGGEIFREDGEKTLLPTLAVQDFTLDVPPGHEQLAFRFAALSYNSPENVQFRYRLEGFENDWIWTRNETQVRYPRLPAGSYEFQVSASTSDGVWSKPAVRVRLRVRPFFWETWWFRIGGGIATVIVTAGVVFFAVRTRHRRQLREMRARQAVEQERARIARDIHDELGASLTRISLLSRPSRGEADPPSPASDGLARIHEISQQLVRAMGEVVWAVTPRNDSLDALANYLGDYAREFLALAEIRCRLDVPLDLPGQQLSAKVRHNVFLAFKECLNNVVKHAGAHEVRIRFIPGPDGFELSVEDDGRGLPETIDRGHGLGNMRERMAEIGGTCEVTQVPGGGGRIVFRAPFPQSRSAPIALHNPAGNDGNS